MNGLLEWRSDKRAKISEITLWSGSALAVMAIHVGTAIWLMRAEPMLAADNSPPPAIMIELAETPEATETEQTDISEQMQDSAPSTQSETVNEPPDETLPAEKIEEQPPEPDEPEPAEDEMPLLENVEAPLPAAKPKPPAPRKQIVRKEEPKKQPPKKGSDADLLK
jgi:protein TonB